MQGKTDYMYNGGTLKDKIVEQLVQPPNVSVGIDSKNISLIILKKERYIVEHLSANAKCLNMYLFVRKS